MQGIEEVRVSTSAWYSIDKPTAIKVGFLACSFIGFLMLSICINTFYDYDYEFLSKSNYPGLKDLRSDAEDLHGILRLITLFPLIFGIMGMLVLWAYHMDTEESSFERVKTTIYGIMFAALGFFIGMAITASIVHNEAWFELKKIEALQLIDVAEVLEIVGQTLAPITAIAIGGLLVCSHLVDKCAKWSLNRLQKKQADLATSAHLNG